MAGPISEARDQTSRRWQSHSIPRKELSQMTMDPETTPKARSEYDQGPPLSPGIIMLPLIATRLYMRGQPLYRRETLVLRTVSHLRVPCLRL